MTQYRMHFQNDYEDLDLIFTQCLSPICSMSSNWESGKLFSPTFFAYYMPSLGKPFRHLIKGMQYL